MKKEIIGNCELYLGDCNELLPALEKVDHIFTDPPYLYLKHYLDKAFDEQLFFEGVKRLIPDTGFIALFGRGTSFYRWNTILAELGFKFKEEIIWNKIRLSSPCNVIGRIHETISIHSKNGVLKKSYIPYLEKKENDIQGIIYDIKRIKSALNNESSFNDIIEYLKTGKINYKHLKKTKHRITFDGTKMLDRDRVLQTVIAIKEKNLEQSIIRINREHYEMEHPTQKPVRLAERILALISNPGDTIYDPFMGSGSFGVACINTDRKYIGSEINPEYFDIACKRIKEAASQPNLFEITDFENKNYEDEDLDFEGGQLSGGELWD